MLKLRKYVRSTTALKSIGTVSEFVGAGGSFVPSSERNFRDETKRVSILLSDKDGNTDLINCAKNVSDDLRSKKLTFSTLGSFPIYEIPQVDVNGDPKMMINPETGEEEHQRWRRHEVQSLRPPHLADPEGTTWTRPASVTLELLWSPAIAPR